MISIAAYLYYDIFAWMFSSFATAGLAAACVRSRHEALQESERRIQYNDAAQAHAKSFRASRQNSEFTPLYVRARVSWYTWTIMYVLSSVIADRELCMD